MYLHILKKDLTRKKNTNIILLIFITLAAMFISSSANNMLTISTALDNYFKQAKVPDYWFATLNEKEVEKFDKLAKENNYSYHVNKFIQINPKNVTLNNKEFNYGNSLCLSTTKDTVVFDADSNKINQINDGEIYVTAEIFNSKEFNLHIGNKIIIESNGSKKEFTLKGYTKDALFGSSMIGMTRFLISENDYNFFTNNECSSIHSVLIDTNDSEYIQKFNNLELNIIFDIDYSKLKMMYFFDMLIAAILVVISICLILISMVILHFTINFTVNEDFREIGVMKAIGIPTLTIRQLYIVKYFFISIIGAIIGFILSIPFSNILLTAVSQNIIINRNNNILLHIFCTIGIAMIVVAFCYFCTHKIKHFSPIDAIRNGETGERYSKKGIIHLNRTKLSPIPFMALNDILSGIKRFISMILIFTLGILLIIIPINAINTLQSDKLLKWFNMAECDHVILQETLFSDGSDNKLILYDKLKNIKETLTQNNIEAAVYQEVMFRVNYPSPKGNGLVTAQS